MMNEQELTIARGCKIEKWLVDLEPNRHALDYSARVANLQADIIPIVGQSEWTQAVENLE